MNYYFLAASLPVLSLDSPPPITSARLRALYREHLSPADFAAYGETLDDAAGDSQAAFSRRWRQADTHIRNAVARTRAARLRTDPLPFLHEAEGASGFIEKAVADAFARSTPVERERALDRLRWRLIDELAGFDSFGADALIAYALQLRLAERWAGMQAEAGRRAAEAIANGRTGETA